MAHIWKMEEPDTWKRCDHYTDSNYPSGGSNGGGLSCAHTRTHTYTDKLAIKGGGQLSAMLFGEPLTANKAWWQADLIKKSHHFGEQKDKSQDKRGTKAKRDINVVY